MRDSFIPQAEAVLFFDNHQIVKQMLYAEFQAILDGYVPMLDVAGQQLKAVYLRIDSRLCVSAAVFFIIDIDPSGFVDKRWNIPLNNLADEASGGPDMGAGPIRLACYSQCPVEWYQDQLWDPGMRPGLNDLLALKKAIKNNTLCLLFKEDPKPSAGAGNALGEELKEHYENEHRIRMARVIKEHRLRINMLANTHKQEIQRLQLEHQERLHEYRQKLTIQQQELLEQKYINEQLKETIDGQADKISGLREYFEHKLALAHSNERDELSALQANYEMELEARIESAIADHKEQLHMREVEILYRNERETKLHEEIIHLQEEKQQLLSTSGDQLLDQLAAAGINYVAYHPGAGHLTIPLMDMASYLNNPKGYAADKCGVIEELYDLWMIHFHAPVCQEHQDNGEICGELLERINHPSNFAPGESDRCQHHKPHQRPVLTLYK